MLNAQQLTSTPSSPLAWSHAVSEGPANEKIMLPCVSSTMMPWYFIPRAKYGAPGHHSTHRIESYE